MCPPATVFGPEKILNKGSVLVSDPQKRPWHTMPAAAAIETLQTSEAGLDDAAVRARLDS